MFERHGQCGTRLYTVWRGMKERCSNPGHMNYPRYGGRGISVCEQWLNSFVSFRDWALENGYRDDLTIDRIDNDGNYEPDNCWWRTLRQQANNKRSDILLKNGRKTMSLRQWSLETGVKYTTLLKRYHNGVRGEALFKKKKGYEQFIGVSRVVGNGNAKLLSEDVQFIRDHPEISGADLSRKFDVAQSTICMIRKGQRRAA